MKRPVILIAMDNDSLCQNLKQRLLFLGFQVLEASDKSTTLQSFQDHKPDLLIVGLSQDGFKDQVEIAEQIRQCDRRFPIILIVTQGSEELAVAALRLGIKDYFKQPFSLEKIVTSVNRCLADLLPRNTSSENKPLIPAHHNSQQMIGEDMFIRKIKGFLLKVAMVDSHTLITGETGTGKELTAQYIHEQSARHKKPLICINCAAVPDSLLESELFGYEKGAFTGACSSYVGKLKLADGGTVFFDEIGDMSPYAQAKILRVLESKEVYPLGGKRSISLDIRIIAATNLDLERLVTKNRFRQDLFYRLNVARIHLPPLRERKDDIPLLIDHFLTELTARFGPQVKGFTREALEVLLSHDWPGNIRELKNVLEALFIDAPLERIAAADLPVYFGRQLQVEDSATGAEHELLLSALTSTNWNKSKAAQQLHWSRMTLYRKMAKYHIQESQIVKSDGENPQEQVITGSFLS